ncbi:MAG: DUF4446 family protein [Lachnospiraceae bacterium]|nr:DUF4446 family protein [Lachnospiraceae bacterium]
MIEQYLGIDSDYIIIGLAALVLVLIILMITHVVQMSKLKKTYNLFMSGKNAKSLEDTLVYRLQQVDELIEANGNNERNIKTIFKRLEDCFQKFGMVKYDAFDEMGGKLSFVIALLNEKNSGYIINVVHSRTGCYSYVKEIIDGNSIVALAEEEEEALGKALGIK